MLVDQASSSFKKRWNFLNGYTTAELTTTDSTAVLTTTARTTLETGDGGVCAHGIKARCKCFALYETIAMLPPDRNDENLK